MKLFIASAAKSGTHFTTEFLNKLDVAVEHENTGKDGIVSWILDRVKDENDYVVLHQTRHPLDTISSCMYLNKDSWKYIRKHLLIEPNRPLLQQCMLYWYWWNKHLDNCTFTYPVEDIMELVHILDLFQIPHNKNKIGEASLLRVEKLGKTPLKKQLEWEDLKKEDYLLATEIRELAQSYGY